VSSLAPNPFATDPLIAASSIAEPAESTTHAIALAAREGLTAPQRSLPPWLFYDEAGSRLFEQITELPEYYPTRTERALFAAHADTLLLSLGAPLTIAELGAGTASKTGLLLRAATRLQPTVLYQPIDISPTALDHARATLERNLPGVLVHPQVANYTTQPFSLQRPTDTAILALYIGSSIGNFSPTEARAILANLRAQLEPGDALLLGTDLQPSPTKSVDTLLAAYNDAAGTTAAFNRNILTHLNRVLRANFDPTAFRHLALWNAADARIEMHLEALRAQRVHIPANSAGPALTLHLQPGDTIHTENSYKFTPATIDALLTDSGFAPTQLLTDPAHLFAVTLASVA
jgi:L-histidine Nalpha-methyltransferase